MRLLLTALTCPKGEMNINLTSHLNLVQQGQSTGCDLVLLPEMSLTGYQASAAIALDHPAVSELVAATVGRPALCFGLVESPPSAADDQRPFITQILAADGAVVVVHRKAGLATDELADFQRGEGSGQFAVAAGSTALAVCAEIGTRPPYAQGASLVLGPAAPGLYGPRRVTTADWQRGYDWWRGSVLGDAARMLPGGSWLAVSTQAGATADEDFPGWAAVVSSDGEVWRSCPTTTTGRSWFRYLRSETADSCCAADTSLPISSKRSVWASSGRSVAKHQQHCRMVHRVDAEPSQSACRGRRSTPAPTRARSPAATRSPS